MADIYRLVKLIIRPQSLLTYWMQGCYMTRQRADTDIVVVIRQCWGGEHATPINLDLPTAHLVLKGESNL